MRSGKGESKDKGEGMVNKGNGNGERKGKRNDDRKEEKNFCLIISNISHDACDSL